MTDAHIDEIDEGIIYLLQQDARNFLATDIADRLPISDTTVRTRLQKLEDQGIIEGYVPLVNYGAAGYPLKIVYSCMVPTDEVERLTQQTLDIPRVISAWVMMSGSYYLRVIAVAEDTEVVADIATQLTDLGLEVEVEELIRREYTRPYTRFGRIVADEDVRGGETRPD